MLMHKNCKNEFHFLPVGKGNKNPAQAFTSERGSSPAVITGCEHRFPLAGFVFVEIGPSLAPGRASVSYAYDMPLVNGEDESRPFSSSGQLLSRHNEAAFFWSSLDALRLKIVES